MSIIRNTDVELAPGSVENTYRRILVSPDKGSRAITLGELIVGPGTELAMHTHQIEEVIVITKGEATAVLGEETYTLGPGDVILAPAGIKHMVANRRLPTYSKNEGGKRRIRVCGEFNLYTCLEGRDSSN